MSYSVNIITTKRPSEEAIFKELSKRGERIIVSSDKYPDIILGTLNEALRGVEIYSEDDELEVCVYSCSSRADYRLFAVVIDVLLDMTSGIAYSEEEEVVTHPYQTFDEKWIEGQYNSWSVASVIARESGSAIIMDGMFLDICVGPHILKAFGINLYGHYKEEKACYEKLSDYLTKMQWALSEARGTQSRLAIPNPEDPDKEPLRISLITIKDNEVAPFDYVSYAPLLAFANLDTGDNVIIRMEDFGKILNENNHFAGFDEWQKRKCGGEPTAEEMKSLMLLAKRYVPEDLHYRPTYPGSGYDDKQRTFVLMWNPDSSATALEDHIRNIRDIFNDEITGKIYEWEEARMGDRFFVVSTGGSHLGVVMTGVFGSQPYLSPQWTGKGRKQYVIDLEPNMILNPETVPMLTTEQIEQAIPSFMWRGGYSGRMLTEGQARALETLYAPYLDGIKEKADGTDLCITRMA